MSGTRELVGLFDHADATVGAVRALQGRNIEVVEAYSPVPHEELFQLVRGKRTSPIRFITFTGALVGLASGFALALLSSSLFELVVGGKPVYSIMPFMVVGFELLILLGALATLGGLLLLARLPHRKFPSPAYRPAFSVDRFGVHVAAKPEQEGEARRLLAQAGAVDVQALAEAAANTPGGAS
jgi:molybdopterin-containing oxidoreductase family membrane subunit